MIDEAAAPGERAAELPDEIAELLEHHPQLADVTAGLGDLDSASVPEQHDRIAAADDALRAMLNDAPAESTSS